MITDERRNELLEIKARLENMLAMFADNEIMQSMVNSILAGVNDELA